VLSQADFGHNDATRALWIIENAPLELPNRGQLKQYAAAGRSKIVQKASFDWTPLFQIQQQTTL
jgi:hypothetical protein